MVQPIENINGLKNQPVKNDYFISDVNWVQPIENIRNPKNRVSEYFIPDEYKIEGQTRTYKKHLNGIEYM